MIAGLMIDNSIRRIAWVSLQESLAFPQGVSTVGSSRIPSFCHRICVCIRFAFEKGDVNPNKPSILDDYRFSEYRDGSLCCDMINIVPSGETFLQRFNKLDMIRGLSVFRSSKSCHLSVI
jgi:hypothetical protein